MWNEIENEADIHRFMKLVGWFHDGCIKELRYTSGAFVAKTLSMHPFNSERTLRMIVQRQYRNPMAVEMEFKGLAKLSMFPADPNLYDCILLGATMIKGDNCIYWCDSGNLSESELNSYEGTLICASKVRWRVADEYIGSEEVYRNRA